MFKYTKKKVFFPAIANYILLNIFENRTEEWAKNNTYSPYYDEAVALQNILRT